MNPRSRLPQRLTSALLIAALVWPSALLPTDARAECPACQHYENALEACKKSPKTGPGEECNSTVFDSRWGQLRQYCDGTKMNEKGKSSSYAGAAMFTAAAAVCWVGCFTSWMGGSTLAACYAAGGLAIFTDVVEGIAIGQMASGLASAVGGGLAGAGAASVGGEGAGGLTMGVDGYGEACGVAAVATIMAGLKWATMAGSDGAARQNCGYAANMAAPGAASEISGAPKSSEQADPKRASGAATSSYKPAPIDSIVTEAQGGLSSAATADPVLKNFTNRDQIPGELDKLGVSLKDIVKGLESKPPSALLANLPGAPANFGEILTKLDKDLHAARTKYEGAAQAGGTGGGPKKAGSDGSSSGSFDDFFATKDGKLGDPVLLGSFSRKPTSVADSTDIWHSDFKGSIFQIVSGRIDKSRDKIQPGEWASPLNRALLGLPVTAPPSRVP